jgi:hypothetical protein
MTTTHQLRFGVGLFTIPKLLDQDFTGTMQLLAEIGYKEVELTGHLLEYRRWWRPDPILAKLSGAFPFDAHQRHAPTLPCAG